MGRILFLDSFDHYDTAHLTDKWSAQGGNVGIVAGAGRTSAALSCGVNGGAVSKNLATEYNELIVGYAVRWRSLGGSTFAGSIGLGLSGTCRVGMGINEVGAVVAYTALGEYGDGTYGGVQAGQSANALIAPNTYYYFEYHFNLTAGTFIGRLNGIEILNLTGVAYNGTSVNQLGANFGQYNSVPWDIDDLYLLDPTDASGGGPSDFLGDVLIQYAPTAAPGRASMWLANPNTEPNWDNVSEVPPDDDTSYAYSNTVGDTDTYKIGAVSGATEILAAQVVALARKDSAGTRIIKIGVGNGVTEVYGDPISLPGEYTYFTQVYNDNPTTGSAFTAADLLELEVAVQVQA